ncbi:receptor-like protein 9DC3 isoform X1 [Camellia sinensis]|uniref:receptor-like protein 9DC3 isoform X1 n=1 Tax=Camellia sinensis TaxID=4442 RepID=UPI0010355457|nr:receptor-like protein 9DC3 isoform X1 [Camellia sinensis]
MFLEVLNILDNQLVGRIPQGSQFNTFGNDLYNGNLALCGFPLSKICEEQQPLPPSPTLQHDENSYWEGGFNWKVVVMGYGCGFVFGMVMGYLMFVTRSPECLLKIVEGKQYKKVKRSKKRPTDTVKEEISKNKWCHLGFFLNFNFLALFFQVQNRPILYVSLLFLNQGFEFNSLENGGYVEEGFAHLW